MQPSDSVDAPAPVYSVAEGELVYSGVTVCSEDKYRVYFRSLEVRPRPRDASQEEGDLDGGDASAVNTATKKEKSKQKVRIYERGQKVEVQVSAHATHFAEIRSIFYTKRKVNPSLFFELVWFYTAGDAAKLNPTFASSSSSSTSSSFSSSVSPPATQQSSSGTPSAQQRSLNAEESQTSHSQRTQPTTSHSLELLYSDHTEKEFDVTALKRGVHVVFFPTYWSELLSPPAELSRQTVKNLYFCRNYIQTTNCTHAVIKPISLEKIHRELRLHFPSFPKHMREKLDKNVGAWWTFFQSALQSLPPNESKKKKQEEEEQKESSVEREREKEFVAVAEPTSTKKRKRETESEENVVVHRDEPIASSSSSSNAAQPQLIRIAGFKTVDNETEADRRERKKLRAKQKEEREKQRRSEREQKKKQEDSPDYFAEEEVIDLTETMEENGNRSAQQAVIQRVAVVPQRTDEASKKEKDSVAAKVIERQPNTSAAEREREEQSTRAISSAASTPAASATNKPVYLTSTQSSASVPKQTISPAMNSIQTISTPSALTQKLLSLAPSSRLVSNPAHDGGVSAARTQATARNLEGTQKHKQTPQTQTVPPMSHAQQTSTHTMPVTHAHQRHSSMPGAQAVAHKPPTAIQPQMSVSTSTPAATNDTTAISNTSNEVIATGTLHATVDSTRTAGATSATDASPPAQTDSNRDEWQAVEDDIIICYVNCGVLTFADIVHRLNTSTHISRTRNRTEDETKRRFLWLRFTGKEKESTPRSQAFTALRTSTSASEAFPSTSLTACVSSSSSTSTSSSVPTNASSSSSFHSTVSSRAVPDAAAASTATKAAAASISSLVPSASSSFQPITTTAAPPPPARKVPWSDLSLIISLPPEESNRLLDLLDFSRNDKFLAKILWYREARILRKLFPAFPFPSAPMTIARLMRGVTEEDFKSSTERVMERDLIPFLRQVRALRGEHDERAKWAGKKRKLSRGESSSVALQQTRPTPLSVQEKETSPQEQRDIVRDSAGRFASTHTDNERRGQAKESENEREARTKDREISIHIDTELNIDSSASSYESARPGPSPENETHEEREISRYTPSPTASLVATTTNDTHSLASASPRKKFSVWSNLREFIARPAEEHEDEEMRRLVSELDFSRDNEYLAKVLWYRNDRVLSKLEDDNDKNRNETIEELMKSVTPSDVRLALKLVCGEDLIPYLQEVRELRAEYDRQRGVVHVRKKREWTKPRSEEALHRGEDPANSAVVPALLSSEELSLAKELSIPTVPCFMPFSARAAPAADVDFELFFTAAMREINRLRKEFLLTMMYPQQFPSVFSFADYCQALADQQFGCNYFDGSLEFSLICDGSLLTTRGDLLHILLTALHKSLFNTDKTISNLSNLILPGLEYWSEHELRTMHELFRKDIRTTGKVRNQLRTKSVENILEYREKYLVGASDFKFLCSKKRPTAGNQQVPSSPEPPSDEDSDEEREGDGEAVIDLSTAEDTFIRFRTQFDDFSAHQLVSILMARDRGTLDMHQLALRLSHLLVEATFTQTELSLSSTGRRAESSSADRDLREQWLRYRSAALHAKQSFAEDFKAWFPRSMRAHVLRFPRNAFFGGDYAGESFSSHESQ